MVVGARALFKLVSEPRKGTEYIIWRCVPNLSINFSKFVPRGIKILRLYRLACYRVP